MGILVVVEAVRRLGREMDEALRVLRSIYGLKCVARPVEVDEAGLFLERSRMQVDGYRYVNHLRRKAREDELIIAITDMDLFVAGYNYCFGLAHKPAAVVSTYRLKMELPSPLEYMVRLRKEVVHEVGHMLGLRHCHDKGCVMYFSNSIADTDAKGERPCPSCITQLRRAGTLV